jgi:hypothetical protein
MEAEKTLKDLDEIKLIRRRFELITVARYRDRSKIRRAMEMQDRIREKTKSDKSLTEEIRKWRDTRYGPSSS